MKRILCILDGMTDPDFRAEAYPNLSHMARLESIDTTQGREPESLGCILRLLGVTEVPAHLRGYAEALGWGIPVDAGSLVLRGSWFARDAAGRCTVPIPGPRFLPQPLPQCRYHALGQYKGLLIFPDFGEFAEKMVTFPPYLCAGRPARELCPRGCEAVRQVFQAQLAGDRCLIPWGQSTGASLPPFPRKAAVVSGTAVVKGIGKLLGMEVLELPEATGDVDTDLSAKAARTLEAAERFPFVLLHINGADEAAHRRDRAEKEAFLHRVDRVLLPALLSSPHSLWLTADHGSDPATGKHTAGPQPVFYRPALPGNRIGDNI